MGKLVSGTFNGTGAAVYICLGFVPDMVHLYAVEDAEGARVRWSKHYRAAESNNGVLDHGGAQSTALYTAGTGIEPYEGGDMMTATNQTSVAYGEGVYLKFDTIGDYKANLSYGFDAVVDTWTLGSSANRTGNFNADTLSSTRIGEGSLILIEEKSTMRQKWAIIEAVTAGQGIAANEVTLSRSIGTGKVLFVGGMYSMIPVPIGEVTAAGFKLNATADINVNDEIQAVEASLFDN